MAGYVWYNGHYVDADAYRAMQAQMGQQQPPPGMHVPGHVDPNSGHWLGDDGVDYGTGQAGQAYDLPAADTTGADHTTQLQGPIQPPPVVPPAPPPPAQPAPPIAPPPPGDNNDLGTGDGHYHHGPPPVVPPPVTPPPAGGGTAARPPAWWPTGVPYNPGGAPNQAPYTYNTALNRLYYQRPDLQQAFDQAHAADSKSYPDAATWMRTWWSNQQNAPAGTGEFGGDISALMSQMQSAPQSPDENVQPTLDMQRFWNDANYHQQVLDQQQRQQNASITGYSDQSGTYDWSQPGDVQRAARDHYAATGQWTEDPHTLDVWNLQQGHSATQSMQNQLFNQNVQATQIASNPRNIAQGLMMLGVPQGGSGAGQQQSMAMGANPMTGTAANPAMAGAAGAGTTGTGQIGNYSNGMVNLNGGTGSSAQQVGQYLQNTPYVQQQFANVGLQPGQQGGNQANPDFQYVQGHQQNYRDYINSNGSQQGLAQGLASFSGQDPNDWTGDMMKAAPKGSVAAPTRFM